jgi:hypothetical protein
MGRHTAAAALLFCGALTLCGCSRTNLFPTAPVRGQVTYQGRPVAGATVEFLCPGAPRRATGTTDEAGNYQLTTFKPNDGAIIGTHVVTVNLYGPESDTQVTNSGTNQSKAIEEAMRQSVRQIEDTEKAKPRIPSKYTERRTSDLRNDVVAGENVINIDLKD